MHELSGRRPNEHTDSRVSRGVRSAHADRADVQLAFPHPPSSRQRSSAIEMALFCRSPSLTIAMEDGSSRSRREKAMSGHGTDNIRKSHDVRQLPTQLGPSLPSFPHPPSSRQRSSAVEMAPVSPSLTTAMEVVLEGSGQ